MTQDVQPLTWQKRTNLEEHQQFFSKINEIIDNLAPTVDEAEAAIAQATAAIASANDAIATANAASAAASAAASQAQTAASTVAGYDTRLTAAEGDIDTAEGNITALQGRMTTAEGKITAIEGRESDYLKKTGAAQTVTSQIMVPTTATGVRDTQVANGTRIQNDLDAYEPMVRTTGNATIYGDKRFEYPILKELVTKDNATVDANSWKRLYTIASTASGSNRHIRIMIPNTRSVNESELMIMWGGLSGAPTASVINKGGSVEIRVCRRNDGNIEVWTNDHVFAYVAFEGIRTAGVVDIVRADLSTDYTTEPSVGDVYTSVVTPTVIQ